ncbi:hypothetical protein [Citrobacter werkmanii]|uniref:hypothetical protein n=1 Tax=Citrobacter werkmanii TaxID=67827 RepID=UPI0037C5B881
MTTFEVQPRKKNSVGLSCFFIAVLIALLLVGSGVEIGYYRQLTSTLEGIEHERNELQKSNNSLRESVIKKLDDQTEIIKRQGIVIDEMKKELHKLK